MKKIAIVLFLMAGWLANAQVDALLINPRATPPTNPLWVNGSIYQDLSLNLWQKVGGTWVLYGAGAGGDLLAANNLADVDNIATALSNLNGLSKAGGTMTGSIDLVSGASIESSAAGSSFSLISPSLNRRIEQVWIDNDIYHLASLTGLTAPNSPGNISASFITGKWYIGANEIATNNNVLNLTGNQTVQDIKKFSELEIDRTLQYPGSISDLAIRRYGSSTSGYAGPAGFGGMYVSNGDAIRFYRPNGDVGSTTFNLGLDFTALTATKDLVFTDTGISWNGTALALSTDVTPAITVQDEGSPLTTAATKLNFVGAGVVVTEPVDNEMTITISGGGGGGGGTPDDDTVTSAKIVDGSVNTADIAASAVTTGKIADGAVTLAKMATASVNSAKIEDNSITTADILTETIGPGDLEGGSGATAGYIPVKNDGLNWDWLALPVSITTEQAERNANMGQIHDKYIEGPLTLSNANVEPSSTPDRGKKVMNFVTSKEVLTLDDSITLEKPFFLSGNTVSDTIVVKPDTGIKLRGSGNIAIDTTMTVDSLYVSNMDIITLMKIREDTYSIAGNFTAALASPFLVYDNLSNGNAEVYTNDAGALSEENASAINKANVGAVSGNVTVTAQAVTDHGYDASYVRQVVANSVGTSRREALDFTVTSGVSCHLSIIIRNTVGAKARFRFTLGTAVDHNTTTTSTDWVKYEIDFTTTGTTLRLDVGPHNGTSATGDAVQYLASIKEN